MYANAIDIAAFALPNSPPNEIWFEDPQHIASVELEFAGRSPQVFALSYWRKTWPEVHPEWGIDNSDPAAAASLSQDDWFNGTWQPAAAMIVRDGRRRLRVAFEPLKSEFPECALGEVCYRRTLGLRLEAPADSTIERISIFTQNDAPPLRLHVSLDAGRPTPSRTIRMEGYFAVVGAVQTGPGFLRMGARLETRGNAERSFTVAVRYPSPPAFDPFDPQLTFVLENERFTISLQDVAQDPIWCEHLGIFITALDEKDYTGITFDEYRAVYDGETTIAERVKAHEEQSLPGAMNGQPRPHSSNYAVGCAHARQNFRIEPNGDIVLCSPAVTRVPARDTPRTKQKAAARFFFGLDKWISIARYPDPDPVLAYEDRQRYLNARDTFENLLARGIVPVVNENDAAERIIAAFFDAQKEEAMEVETKESKLAIHPATEVSQ
ncbi:MAG: hypothetical protein R6V12_17700 [Candidatus Hydrogenedentota bacterium]